jgi:membrane fusion protein, multidrug efflux system
MTFDSILLRSFTAPVLLLLTATLFAGCGAEADPVPSSPAPAPVQVATAQPAASALSIRSSGRLGSKADIPLAFKIGGVINEVLVDEGESVQRGQMLARLQLPEINAQVQQAESVLLMARRDLERTHTLHRDSVATLEQLQNAETAVEMAEARLRSARFNRRHAVIEAPSSGRVLQRMAEAGQTVSGGQPILRLGAASSGFVLRVGLPDREVVRVGPGDSASVQLDVFPGQRVSGRISEVAGAVTPQTGTYEVEVRLNTRELGPRARQLRSGFTGTVELFPAGGADFVMLPARALVEGDGNEGVVFIMNKTNESADSTDASASTAKRMVVQVEGFRQDEIAVRGISAGTPVIVRGAASLRDGEPVRAVNLNP